MPISSHKNFALSTMASPPSSTDGTSLTVATGTGTRFPAVPFNATLWPAGVQPTVSNAEVVRVTAIVSDVFTIVRAQEGSSARTHSANDQIAATITARTLTDVEYGAHNIVNVMDPAYGAVGDGVTDDTAAIQAAVTAAIALGGEVFFPPTTSGYLITDDIVCDPGNNGVVAIRGTGYGSTILCGAADISCFYIDPGTSNFQQAYIQGLRFEMGSYDSRAIFWEQNGQHGVISDIWIDGSASQLGGLIELGLAASASGAVCTYLRDLRIRGGGAAAGIRFTDQFHSVTFDNVEVTGCVNAIDNDTTDATTASNINVLNCRLDDGTSGLVLRGCTLAGLTVTGTRFENNTSYGIDLQGFDATNNRMLNVVLTGNYFTSLQTGRVGVRAHRVVGFNLIGNHFRAAVGLGGYPDGIGLEFVSGVTQVVLLNNTTSPTVSVNTTVTGYTGVPLGRDNLFANQTSVLWSAPRYVGSGTEHVAGDYAASAGWGTSPTITPLARDTGGRVSVTAKATPGANPTLTLTFKDGTWTTAPAVTCSRGDALATAGYWSLTTVSATAVIFTFVGTPVADEVYVLDFVAMGK